MSELRRALVVCLVAALALAGVARLQAGAAPGGAPAAIEIAGIAVALCLDGAADQSPVHPDCDHCALRGAATLPPPSSVTGPTGRRFTPMSGPCLRSEGTGRVLEAAFARGPPSA